MSGTKKNTTRKEFTFDLDVNELRKYFGDKTKKTKKYTKAYRELKNFFLKRNFEHRQGSVYSSNEKMTSHDILDIIEELKKECPWVISCLTRMDVADIGDLHELTGLIK